MATANVAMRVMRMAFLTKPSPSTGEMASTFTTFSLTGNEPVMRMVWRRFMFCNAVKAAASLAWPAPLPDICIWVTACPLRSDPMLSSSTFWSSRYSSRGLLR